MNLNKLFYMFLFSLNVLISHSQTPTKQEQVELISEFKIIATAIENSDTLTINQYFVANGKSYIYLATNSFRNKERQLLFKDLLLSEISWKESTYSEVTGIYSLNFEELGEAEEKLGFIRVVKYIDKWLILSLIPNMNKILKK